MPCDTVSTYGVELGKNIDPGLLVLALQALGLYPQRTASKITFYGGSYDLETKTATIKTSAMQGSQPVDTLTAKIKVAYGHQIAQQYAKKYGWKLTATADNKYALTKTTY